MATANLFQYNSSVLTLLLPSPPQILHSYTFPRSKIKIKIKIATKEHKIKIAYLYYCGDKEC